MSMAQQVNAEGDLEELLRVGFRDVDELDDFIAFDPLDQIHQEFEPSIWNDPSSWRDSRPTWRRSLLECFHVVFMITLVFGAVVGFLALIFLYLDVNTADLCFDVTWASIPRKFQSIHVAGQAFEGFVIELWQLLTVLPIFKWPLIHRLHLLPLNLVAAFSDSVYRLLLYIFNVYQNFWRSYPLNGLSSSVYIFNGLIIGRDIHPDSWKKAISLALRLSCQFVLGLPVAYPLVYVLFPWYSRQKNELFKVFIAGCAPLTAFIPKVVSRIVAQNLHGVMHPGAAFILVASVYNATSIVFRIMQADLESFSLFVLLGFGHAFFDLLERLSITYRDYLWQKLYSIIFCWRSEQGRRITVDSTNTYKAQRLVADMSIQCMMAESAALINAVGLMHLFEFLFHRQSTEDLIWKFLKRIAAGLSIDCIFSVISVFLQTRTKNIAVVRVWKAKWRLHTLISAITSVLVVLYFSEHLLMVVKNKHTVNANFTRACTRPFARRS